MKTTRRISQLAEVCKAQELIAALASHHLGNVGPGGENLGDEPFAVPLGDDLIEVPQEKISSYGCADVSVVEGKDYGHINHLVEKPAVEDAPPNFAVIGAMCFTRPCLRC